MPDLTAPERAPGYQKKYAKDRSKEKAMQTSTRQIRLWLFSICTILLPVFGWPANVTVDCSGVTSGAFASLQAAIDSLDVVGPHQITLAPQTCKENVRVVDRQRLTINAAPTGAFIESAAGAAGDVMTILRSTAITFVQVGFRGGRQGVVIGGSSGVGIYGTTVESNADAGVNIFENSTVGLYGLIQNNGGNGIVVSSSNVRTNVGTGARILNNGGDGIGMNGSRGFFAGNTIQGNNNGVYLVNASSVNFYAPNTIKNNRRTGVTLFEGSAAEFSGSVDSRGVPVPNLISGNQFIGLNMSSSSVTLGGPNEISNNGSGMQLFRAGVRADFNSTLITAGSGDIKITGNTGPGIEVTTGSLASFGGTVVTQNTGNGVRLIGNGRVVILAPNVLTGNGGPSIKCDHTSLYVTNATQLPEDTGCQIVQLTGQ